MADTTMRVHPVAALLPMLSEEELDDLAADIKANGLLHPIVLDADGVLVDGRNRLEACRRAGVAPTYTSLNGHDPVAYVLGANVARRHLNAGQRAMAVAKARLFSGNNRQEDLAAAAEVSRSRIAYAAVVLEHAPELADAVMAGAVGLNDAYARARRRKSGAGDVADRIAELLEGIEANWEAARLTYENTVEDGEKPGGGRVALDMWCRDVSDVAARPFGLRQARLYRRLWERYGGDDPEDRPSWIEALDAALADEED